MTALHISKGGQISLPAAIRRRWATTEVIVEDLGDAVVLRPMPPDPIGAARGALGPARVPLDAARAKERTAEAERERGRFAQPRS